MSEIVAHGSPKLKESPDAIELAVPTGEGEVQTVSILRPVHPNEDIFVELTELGVGAIIKYVRGRDGAGEAAIPDLRAYNRSTPGSDRLWSMGSGRAAVVDCNGKRKYVKAKPASCEGSDDGVDVGDSGEGTSVMDSTEPANDDSQVSVDAGGA